MTPEILVELGAIYVRHFRALQHDVLDMLSGKTRDDWDPTSSCRSSSSSPRTRRA